MEKAQPKLASPLMLLRGVCETLTRGQMSKVPDLLEWYKQDSAKRDERVKRELAIRKKHDAKNKRQSIQYGGGACVNLEEVPHGQHFQSPNISNQLGELIRRTEHFNEIANITEHTMSFHYDLDTTGDGHPPSLYKEAVSQQLLSLTGITIVDTFYDRGVFTDIFLFEGYLFRAIYEKSGMVVKIGIDPELTTIDEEGVNKVLDLQLRLMQEDALKEVLVANRRGLRLRVRFKTNSRDIDFKQLDQTMGWLATLDGITINGKDMLTFNETVYHVVPVPDKKLALAHFFPLA